MVVKHPESEDSESLLYVSDQLRLGREHVAEDETTAGSSKEVSLRVRFCVESGPNLGVER